MKAITILVVDDEHANVYLLTEILRLYNYTVISAYDGSEAMDSININKPDLVLLDIMMPKYNGMEVLGMVKRDDLIKNTPIIMVSAKNEIEDIEAAYRLGADDYITKPITGGKIVPRIKNVMLKYSEGNA